MVDLASSVCATVFLRLMLSSKCNDESQTGIWRAFPVFITENGRVKQVHGRASGRGGVRRRAGQPTGAGRQLRDLQRADRPANPNSRPGREPEGRLPVKDRPLQRRQQLDCYLVVLLQITSDVDSQSHATWSHLNRLTVWDIEAKFWQQAKKKLNYILIPGVQKI